MGQSGGLNLNNVLRHVPGRDASLWGVNALHSAPVKASTDGRNKEFAVTIAQNQRAKCIR